MSESTRDLLAPRDFFVSMIRDSRTALLAGPFATHEAALASVESACKEANRVDPWSDFDAFGTCSLVAPSGRKGVLNSALTTMGVVL